MAYITQTLAQIKSLGFIGHIKQHFMTSSHICHQWYSGICKMLYQKLGAPRPSTRQPASWWTTTYNAAPLPALCRLLLTTQHLCQRSVDYYLQRSTSASALSTTTYNAAPLPALCRLLLTTQHLCQRSVDYARSSLKMIECPCRITAMKMC